MLLKKNCSFNKINTLIVLSICCLLLWKIGKVIYSSLCLKYFIMTLPHESEELLRPYFYLARYRTSKVETANHKINDNSLMHEPTSLNHDMNFNSKQLKNNHMEDSLKYINPNKGFVNKNRQVNTHHSGFLNFTHFEAKYQQFANYFTELYKWHSWIVPNSIPSALEISFQGKYWVYFKFNFVPKYE